MSTAPLRSHRTATAMTTLAAARPPSTRAARAHELKNCLALVAAVSKLVELEASERSRGRLARMNAAVRRMMDLIEEDLADAPSSRSTLSPAAPDERVAIDALVRDVAVRVADRAACARVALELACAGGALYGHADELTEALANLAANAIDACPAGGVVAVATARTPEGDHEWTVRDTGCGMTPEVLEQLGRPFYSRRAGGSGVGLAMAHDVIARHGGRMRIESAPGAGTTVTIWLPRGGARA